MAEIHHIGISTAIVRPRLFQDEFFKWTILALFLFFFGLFQTINTFFTRKYSEKCPSSIPYWDSKPQPLERKSPPITTTPGFPPFQVEFYSADDRVLSLRGNSARILKQ